MGADASSMNEKLKLLDILSHSNEHKTISTVIYSVIVLDMVDQVFRYTCDIFVNPRILQKYHFIPCSLRNFTYRVL